MEMRLENLLCKSLQVNTKSLFDLSNGCHPLNVTASFLFRVCLSFQAELVDHLHRIYRLIKLDESHCEIPLILLLDGAM